MIHELPRHFIVLVDGTWVSASRSDPNSENSNIYKLNYLLKTHNHAHEAQVTMYIPGIGSKTDGNAMFAGALADGLERQIEVVYTNICSNFVPEKHDNEEQYIGDKLYLFGFSRGAVTAWIVADIITKCGLLKCSEISTYDEIFKHYITSRGEDDDKKFKDQLNEKIWKDVKIELLGLFDTVIGNYRRLPSESLIKTFDNNRKVLSKDVKNIIHVLAMNETRLFFNPILFDAKDDKDQTLNQIWMPGCHSDIGGTYRDNDLLGKMSLLTMINKIKDLRIKLGFNDDKIQKDFIHVIETALQNDSGFIIHDERYVGKLYSERNLEDKCNQFIHPFYEELKPNLAMDNSIINYAEKRDLPFGDKFSQLPIADEHFP